MSLSVKSTNPYQNSSAMRDKFVSPRVLLSQNNS